MKIYDDDYIQNAVPLDDYEDMDDYEETDQAENDVDAKLVLVEIAITVDIKEADQANITNALDNYEDCTDDDWYYSSTNRVYQTNYSIKIGNAVVRIRCYPISKTTPFLHITWDPSAVIMDDLIQWLIMIFGEKISSRILLESRVSKISANAVISTTNFDCFIFKPCPLKSAIEWENGSHRIIKQTIGDEKGRTLITLWNTSTVRKKEFFGTTELREHELSITLKSTKSSILNAYSMLVKEFDGLEFYSTQIIYDVILDPAIIAILVSNGMNAGFYQFDPRKRYTLKDYFMQYEEDNIDTSENSVRAAWESAFGSFNGYEL